MVASEIEGMLAKLNMAVTLALSLVAVQKLNRAVTCAHNNVTSALTFQTLTKDGHRTGREGGAVRAEREAGL